MNKYGIKFPIKNNSNYLLDFNNNKRNEIKSKISLLISTKKRTWLRRPNYGLNLNKYLFEPLTSNNANKIKSEIKNILINNIFNISINDIQLTIDENENFVGLEINYTINTENIYNDKLLISF